MRILELTLQSRDIAAQRTFYHDLFGLPVVEEDIRRITLQAGYTRLAFEQTETSLPDTIYHFALNIPENQIMQAKDWLTARTAIIVGPENEGREIYDFKSWNAHAFYFLDADGNIVEFIARHHLDNASDGPFTGRSLLGVSEIGLATPDVIQTVTQLQQNLGLEVWDGAGNEAFSAVGDEQGLFILVAVGRTWLSSDRQALPLVTQVTIEGDADGRYDLPGLPVRIRRSAMTTAPR